MCLLVGKVLAVNLGLDEVGTVEDDVDEKPGLGAREEITAMGAEELFGEEGVRWRRVLWVFGILCDLAQGNI